MNEINITSQNIKFFIPNRSLIKVLNNNSLLADVPNKNSIISLGNLLSTALIKKDDPPRFESVKEIAGLDYIGYIIDKEKLNRKTGIWDKIDEFRIIGSNVSSFIDTRITYGEIYRYKIKTLMKVTKKERQETIISNASVRNLNNQLVDSIKNIFSNNKKIISSANSFAKLKENTEIKLVNNLTLVVNKDATFIKVAPPSQQVPLRIDENLQTTNNLKKGDIFIDLEGKVKKIDEKIYSSYYESLPSRDWNYVDIVENKPPPPPTSIKIVPSSVRKLISVYWLRPAQEQRDIKAYKVYRRESIGSPWQLLRAIREIDINGDGVPEFTDGIQSNSTNSFIDTTVEFNKKYIYALSCLDIHGNESFLSTQIEAQLNPNFSVEKEEKPLKWISGSGARIDQLNFIYKKFLDQKENIIVKKGLIIKVSENFNETNKHFLIKVRSLDTHEKKEFKISLKNSRITT